MPSTKASAVMEEIAAKGWLGLSTRTDPVRTYPAKDVGANLIGFLGDEGKPAAGLEQVFNNQLAGRDGSDTFQVGGGNRIPLGDNSQVKPHNGDELELTIDRDAQWYAQKMLRNVIHDTRAKSATLVAVDTRTGEVLALADSPTFDANRGSKASDEEWGSRGLSNVYEPGSVQKVLTAAALIEEGKVTPGTRITVPKKLPVLDREIGDYFDHGRIRLTLAGVIAKSSNIGTVLAARQISSTVLDSYLRKFGLGSRTGVGIPGETRGLLPQGSTWSELTKATISFGQGLSVNALQMTAAVNAIANGGEYISPSLVKGRATTTSGTDVGTDTAQRRRVISKDTARQVSEMME
ncbi:MAG: penicillin-binding protein 2, partial [Myxococcales bacterium]